MLQTIFRKISTLLYKPLLAKYLKQPRVYRGKTFKLIILPGVFHPSFFYSTLFLLKYLKKINLNNTTVVEVGAGSGLIAFNMALRAKKVLAIELSQIALQGLNINLQNNSSHIPRAVLQIIESNLFQAITPCVFDYIIVNPPYYPNKVKNENELAWNCGEQFEYFNQFFEQAGNFMNNNSKIIMVLSSQCNLVKINEIALDYGFFMHLKATKKYLIEDNYIYEISKK